MAAIEACKSFISYEKSNLDSYYQDELEYLSKISEIKPLIYKKRKFGTNTLEKLSEKYSLNAYINQKIVKGFNRRKLLLLHKPQKKINEAELLSKIKKTKHFSTKLKMSQLHLSQKIEKYEKMFEKIKKLSKDDETVDIHTIIHIFQQRAELLGRKAFMEKSLQELKTEKVHLEEQLEFIVSSKPHKDEEDQPTDIQFVSDNLFWTYTKTIEQEKKLHEQDLKIIKIQE